MFTHINQEVSPKNELAAHLALGIGINFFYKKLLAIPVIFIVVLIVTAAADIFTT